jgi:hypothetical protein
MMMMMMMVVFFDRPPDSIVDQRLQVDWMAMSQRQLFVVGESKLCDGNHSLILYYSMFTRCSESNEE